MASSTLRRRLKAAQTDIHTSFSGDLNALLAFHDSWSGLSEDLTLAARNSPLDAEIEALWDETATKVALASELMISIKSNTEELQSSYTGELESIFTQFEQQTSETAAADSPPVQGLPLEETCSPSDNKKDYSRLAQPSHTRVAHSWLLKHLHNPYPSKAVRSDLAEQTNSSLQAIDTWFIDVRRRMGWTNLRKKRFGNKRADIVQAATMFFNPGQHGSEVDPVLELEFSAMKRRVEGMYQDKLDRSYLDLDITSMMQESGPKDGEEAHSEEKTSAANPDHDPAPVATSTSSVDSAPATPPMPSTPKGVAGVPQDSSGNPPSSAGKKRRACSVELPSDSPQKRARHDAPPQDSFHANPSSPFSQSETFREGSTASSSSSRSSSPCSTGPPTPPSTRKRKSIESEDGRQAKKSCYHQSAQPFIMEQTTEVYSEPFDFDNWFANNSINTTTSWNDELSCPPFDIELFDYSKLGTSSRNDVALKSSNPISLSLELPELPPYFDGPVTTVQTNDLDNVFDNYPETNPGIAPGQDIQTFYPDFSAGLQTFSSNSHLADSQALGMTDYLWQSEPSSYNNWFTSSNSQNGLALEMTPNHLDVAAPQINASSPTLSLPPRISCISPSDTLQVTKAEKERRLAEIQEEARRLREEIAQS